MASKYSTYQNISHLHDLQATAVFDGYDWKLRFSCSEADEPIYLLHSQGAKLRTFKTLDAVAVFIGKYFNLRTWTVVSEKQLHDIFI